ncbi:MAG: FMN-binding protein [Lachnospiraceae bacterium]|nr:FMN-binding protein [Lachnospiraceae bacterium]
MTDKKSIMELLKNTAIMLAITVIAGGVLGVVYETTKGPIAIMQEKARNEANATVFADAASFSGDILDKDRMKEVLAESYSGVEITEVLEAKGSDGSILGYVMEVTSHEGYGGNIVFRIGLLPDGTTNGISITEISETAGLGMRAEEVIVPQFKDRRAEAFEVSKNGGSEASNRIEAISSATITSKAIVNGVNASLVYLREVLEGGSANE